MPRGIRGRVFCSIDNCGQPAKGFGMCKTHYGRWKRTGDPRPNLNRPTIEDRFWAKVDKKDPNGCWLWTAATNGVGYGKFGRGKASEGLIYAHRFSYELLVGPIPDGLQLDHLCRVRNCVNPVHLEPVDARTNLLRGMSPVAFQARQTHCKRGHPFSSENTYVTPSGERRCRICQRARDAAWKRRRADANKSGRPDEPVPTGNAGLAILPDH